MKILVGGWFGLPLLGKDSFTLLMKQGVTYNKEMGFRIDSQTDVGAAARLIGTLIGEKIELVLRCFVCGREACAGCPYLDWCDRKAVSSMCLCGEHASMKDIYQSYSKLFKENLEA